MPFNRPKPLEIIKIKQETPRIKSFRFKSEEITSESHPGQFLMLTPITYKDEVPIAIASVFGSEFEVAVTKVGDCTTALHEKRIGDRIGVRGPYGNCYNLFGEHTLIFNGGYGSAVNRYPAEVLRKEDKEVTVAVGAKTKADLLYCGVFDSIGCDVHVTTEDGSADREGIVTDILPELFELKVDLVLICGPELMAYKVVKEAKKRNIPSQVCNERITKCAMGVCGACDLGGRRTCKEGHIASGEELLKTEFGKVTRDKTGSRVSLLHGSENISFEPLKPLARRKDPLLEMKVDWLYYPNTVMNASGSGFASGWLYRLARAGAGAVVTKSIGPEPREGYNGPNFIEYELEKWANAMGLPNTGIENYRIELQELKPALEPARIPIDVSIFGKGIDGYRHVGLHAVEYGADALEINASCPHTELKSVEADPDFLKDITKAVVEIAHPKQVLVSVKLSPNIDYIESAKAAEEGGADAIVLTNALRVKPTYDFPGFTDLTILGNPTGFGGGSWKAVAEKSERALAEAYREIDVPIFNVGGISWKNIVDRFLLGATGCQMATVFAYAQPEEVFRKCTSVLRKYVRSNGYGNVKEIIGTGNKR